MKADISNIVSKLMAYARDNLMLDALDETYTVNRLAAITGASAIKLDCDAEYGDATLQSLLGELAAAAPATDKRAVVDLLMPVPHTAQMYFSDTYDRNPKKAFDFIFELFAMGGCASDGEAGEYEGYVRYTANTPVGTRSIVLDADGDVKYTPVTAANRIATVASDDILSFDTIRRQAALSERYGFTAVKRIGANEPIYCCDKTALELAAAKEQLAGGAVKTALLDYPVPVIAFSGIAKNTVISSAVKTVHAAETAGVACVTATAVKDGSLTVYAVFAKDIATDNVLISSNALTACGVFQSADLSELLSILEKGTALPTDQMAYKAIYDDIGGVKLGAKAKAKLDEHVCSAFEKALAAAASTDGSGAKALTEEKQTDDAAGI